MITQEAPKRIEDVARPKLRGTTELFASRLFGCPAAVITLGTYPHTLPGMQREAASKLAAMVLGS
jgi:hypothetical protein